MSPKFPSVLPGIEHNPVEEYHWIYLFQWPVLPLLNFRQYFVRYFGNQSLGFIRAIDFPHRILDIPLAHSLGVHCHDLFFDFFCPCLTLRNDPRLKFSVPIPGYRDFAFSVVTADGLFSISVPAVSAVVSRHRMLFVSQVFLYFRFLHLLDCSRKQLLQLFLDVSWAFILLHYQFHQFLFLLC